MREVLCGCFGRGPPEQRAAQSQQHASLEQPPVVVAKEPSVQSLRVEPPSFQEIIKLRARLACASSVSWTSKLVDNAALLANACDAGLIGILGASVLGSEQVLVVLATGGPAAAALGIGELLPWTTAQDPCATDAAGCVTRTAAVPLPPWEPPAYLRSPHPQSSRASSLEAKDGTSADRSRLVAGSQLFGREVWHRVLSTLQRVLPPTGPARWHLMLLPLTLGPRLVGALLLGLPASPPPQQSGRSSADSGGNGVAFGLRKQQGVPPHPKTTATLHAGLLQHGELLMALGDCVAECCLAPVLPAIDRVCTSAALLGGCTTIQELSTVLTTSLATFLASELHVELAVRLALLPSRDATQGLLLDDTSRMRPAGGTGTGVISTGACGSASGGGAGGTTVLQQPRSGAVPFLSVHRSPSQARPATPVDLTQAALGPGAPKCIGSTPPGNTPAAAATLSQRSVGISSLVGNGGGAGGISSRVSVLQAEAAKAALLEASGPVSSDDVLLGGMGSPAMKRGGGGGVTGSSGANARRTLSTMLALGGGRGPIRASTFSLASTLAASLLAGATAAANGGASGSGSGSGTGADATGASGVGGSGVGSGHPVCTHAFIALSGAGRVGSVAAEVTGPWGTPYAVRLAGAVVANVHSYLQDTEQPTADVFAVLRRQGTNFASTSLVAVAAWSASGGGGGGGGGDGATTTLLTPLQTDTAETRHTGKSSKHRLGGGGGGGGAGELLNDIGYGSGGVGSGGTGITQNSCTGNIDLPPRVAGGAMAWASAPVPVPGGGGGAAAAAGVGVTGAPAFVLYLTSGMPLPLQLLDAVRNRAMVLLEVLLPVAARVLAAQDEWWFLSAQVAGGAAAAAAAAAALGAAAGLAAGSVSLIRSCSMLVPDRAATASGMAAPTQSDTPPLFMSGSRGLRAAVLAGTPTGAQNAATYGGAPPRSSRTMLVNPPSPPVQQSRSPHGSALLSAGVLTPRGGGGGGGGGAGGLLAAAAAVLSPVLGARRGSRCGEPPPSPSNRSGLYGNMELSSRDDAPPPPSATSGAGRLLAVTAANGLRTQAGSTSRTSLRYGTSPFGTTAAAPPPPAASAAAGLDINACGPLDTYPYSSGLLALEEDDEGRGGHGDADGAGGNGGMALLSTVLSDGQETSKAARQAHLNMMVSTFHSTLIKARHDAGALGGLHAEDDVRSLQLVKTLGTGGCSVVMLARLHAMPVAVKVILPPPSDSDDDEENNTVDGAGTSQGGRRKAGKAGDRKDVEDADDAQLLVLPPGGKSGADSGGGGGGGGSLTGRARCATRPSPSPAARQMQMRLLMRGARELAVMTSISHPNIVQVYSYCTHVVVQESASGLPKLEVVPEGSNVKDPICTALIMEYCDMGSLADAIDTGAFARAAKAAAAALQASNRTRPSQSVAMGRADRGTLQETVSAGTKSASLGGAAAVAGSAGLSRAQQLLLPAVAATAGTPAMRAVYLTLLEVSLALRHLHAQSLVHCDVKPANVLLRSSATDPRGFTAKLTDFGFVNLIEQRQSDSGTGGSDLASGGGAPAHGRGSVKFAEPVGTVTHMAPELFIQGHPADASIDVYAFGILMWELGTGRAPYPEYAEGQFVEVPYKVVKEGLRPRFPSDTPLHYKLLAQECWSSQPARRPTAAALVSRLQRLLDLSCGFITEANASQESAGPAGAGAGSTATNPTAAAAATVTAGGAGL